MDEKEIQKKINALYGDINSNQVKSSSLLLTIILTAMGLIGAGVIVGAIFDAMALSVIAGIWACAPVLATKVMQYSELVRDTKACKHQIDIYNQDIKKMQEKRAALDNPKPKKTIEVKPTKKYSYDKAKKETPKKQEIPIEYFDERDFDDYQPTASPKKR